MENTFLPELPNGHETGEFLALDLGGTNFRVMYLRIQNGKFVEQDSQVREHCVVEIHAKVYEKTINFDK